MQLHFYFYIKYWTWYLQIYIYSGFSYYLLSRVWDAINLLCSLEVHNNKRTNITYTLSHVTYHISEYNYTKHTVSCMKY